MTTPRARLLYVTDPMCSWCWGFAPVMAAARERLLPDVGFERVLGGLAPDSDVPMDDDLSEYIRGQWRAVTARTGATFDHGFWDEHRPARSTWPACRAVIAAGERGDEMFAAIQRAYYAERRDPSDRATLVELAGELDLDDGTFAEAIDAESTRAALDEHFALRDRLGVRNFPSVGAEVNGELQLVTTGWAEPDELLAGLVALGLAHP